jgi:hypothetical protein
MKRLLILGVALLVLGSPVFADVMKMTAVRIEIPKEGSEVLLAALKYGENSKADFTAEINSVRYAVSSKEGEPKVTSVWHFKGSNTAGSIQRVAVTVYLLDGKDKRLGMGTKKINLHAGADHQEFEVAVKVKAGKWEQAVKVQIQVDFETH